LEPGQQFEQEHSGCVRDDLFDISEDQRVAIVKLGVYDGGGYCFGGVKVKVATDTAESTNVMIAGFSIWIHIGYVSIFSGMFTIVCCFAVGLGVGLGLELDLVSGW